MRIKVESGSSDPRHVEQNGGIRFVHLTLGDSAPAVLNAAEVACLIGAIATAQIDEGHAVTLEV